MNNDVFHNELTSLERRIKLVISEQIILKEELEFALRENKELKNKVFQKESELSDYQTKFKLTRIADNLVVNDNPTELIELIDNYILEIDKCISHLSES